MTTKYTDAPRTRVMTPASLNNGVHENHSIGQTMAIAPKKGLFDDISIPQTIAGAAAAATSVALASKIGIAGSVIGAAVSSVITVVSSQVYRHFISASAEALKGTHATVDYPAGAYEPVELNAEEHLGGAATTQEMRQIAGRATTARVAPDSLRAKAAAERSQTQKKVIIFSIAIAIVAVIAFPRKQVYRIYIPFATSTHAFIASMTALLNPCSSNTPTASIVVPAGEHTLSFNTPGCSPVSSCNLALPIII